MTRAGRNHVEGESWRKLSAVRFFDGRRSRDGDGAVGPIHAAEENPARASQSGLGPAGPQPVSFTSFLALAGAAAAARHAHRRRSEAPMGPIGSGESARTVRDRPGTPSDTGAAPAPA